MKDDPDRDRATGSDINAPRYIIIHTAASATREGTPIYQPIETVRQYHIQVNGWQDIGYHYYIERDGAIKKGREEFKNGAHCVDMNMNGQSIGVCCAGHGDYADFNEAQYAALYGLIADIMVRYNIHTANVLGHRETGANKTCPGKLVDMAKIRERLATVFT